MLQYGMKLTKWAKWYGVCYHTALRWFHSGKMPCRAEKLPSGMILVFPDEKPRVLETGKEEGGLDGS